jgi:hypothetical protein
VQTIRDAIKTGDEITVRILNYKRSGTPFWNMFTLAPMKDSDDTIRFLVGVQVRLAQRWLCVTHMSRTGVLCNRHSCTGGVRRLSTR